MNAMTLSQALTAQPLEFPAWEEMSDLERLHSIWWDAYKDAYGFRPRGVEVGHWTVEDFHAELERLDVAIGLRIEEDRAREKEAILSFEAHLAEVINGLGAANRETALRWIMEADECGGDWEFLCFKNGLPYGYFKTESQAV